MIIFMGMVLLLVVVIVQPHGLVVTVERGTMYKILYL